MRVTRRAFLGASASAIIGATVAPAFGDSPVVLKYGNVVGPELLSNKFNQKLADLIAAETNNKVQIQIFAGTLSQDEKTLLEGASLGLVDIYNGSYTGTREFDILYCPGVFKDGAHVGRAFKGLLGQKASVVLEQKYGVRLLGIGRLGPYTLFLKNAVESLADLKGMKIRTPQIEGNIAAIEGVGANPTPMPFSEVYLALQQGLIDGLVTALDAGVAAKFYEVCKYVVANDFGQALEVEVISKSALDRLKPDQADLLFRRFTELEEVDYFQAGLDLINTNLNIWREKNGQDSVLTVDSADIEAALGPTAKRLVKEVYGDEVWNYLQATREG